MSLTLTRRRLLASGVAAGALPLLGLGGSRYARAANPVQLIVERRSLDVNGKAASVLGVRQPNGESGLILDPGQRFQVSLRNALSDLTIVHWHGQVPPPDQDGVPEFNIPPLKPGEIRDYDFAARAGTHWMHSHQGLQEQALLAGPLIVRSAADAQADEQEVVVLFHDFSFRSPEEILASVVDAAGGQDQSGMSMQSGQTGGKDMSKMQGMDSGKPDLNDVNYDAYLANDRTLGDPQVVRTERGGKVRLRLINGATGTAFWIDLGGTEAEVVAADGDDVQPIKGKRFPVAQSQRIDLRLTVPAGAVVPVFAQREGDVARTGILLAAPGATVGKVSAEAETPAPPVDLSLEMRLAATEPLPQRPVDNAITVQLTGTMSPYAWTLDNRNWADHLPLRVKKGQRVAVKLVNQTMMAHPMHLHGHHFQMTSLNGLAVNGALRDTILVTPKATVEFIFDADNPGRWLFHCHNLLHMATGMITEVAYDAA